MAQIFYHNCIIGLTLKSICIIEGDIKLQNDFLNIKGL